MADGTLQALGIRGVDIDLLRDRTVPLDQPMPYDPSYQVPGSPPAQRVGDVAGGALQALPSVGDAYSVLQAIAEYEQGKYGSAAMNALGALPMVAGTFAGVGAKTADLLKLEKAHKMLADGLDPADIWRQTGWTNQFPDGKWRFEVDDSAADYRPGRVKSEKLPKEKALLQKEYDTLVDARMLRTVMDDNPELTVGQAKEWFAKHFDQPPQDGSGYWAKFSTVEEIRGFENEALNRLLNPRIRGDVSEFVDNAGLLSAYPELAKTNLVITPASEMDGAWGLYHGPFGGISLSDDVASGLLTGKSTLFHELQHGIQDMEGFARGSSMDAARNRPDEYFRTAGEAEARLVQKRLNYTPERRQQIPPWTEFDVPVQRQIVRGGRGPALSVPKSLKNLRGEKIPVPETYYRGERVGGDKSKTTDDFWNRILFAASDRKSAESYAGSAGVVHEFTPKPDAKILYEGTKDFISLNKGNKGKNLLKWASEASQRAANAGYDAVWFKRQGDIGTAILNREAFNLPEELINQDSGVLKSLVKSDAD